MQVVCMLSENLALMQSSSATASELVSTARSSCCFKCKCRKAAMGKQQRNSRPLHDCKQVISLLHQTQSASNTILSVNKLYCLLVTPIIVTRNSMNQVISKSHKNHDSMSKESTPTEAADLACNHTFRAGICYTCCMRRASQQLHQSYGDR